MTGRFFSGAEAEEGEAGCVAGAGEACGAGLAWGDWGGPD